jgi:hypothetical protein
MLIKMDSSTTATRTATTVLSNRIHGLEQKRQQLKRDLTSALSSDDDDQSSLTQTRAVFEKSNVALGEVLKRVESKRTRAREIKNEIERVRAQNNEGESSRSSTRTSTGKNKKNESKLENVRRAMRLSKNFLNALEFEIRCERVRVFKDLNNLFCLTVKRTTTTKNNNYNNNNSNNSKAATVMMMKKMFGNDGDDDDEKKRYRSLCGLPDINAFAYSSHQTTSSSVTSTTTKNNNNISDKENNIMINAAGKNNNTTTTTTKKTTTIGGIGAGKKDDDLDAFIEDLLFVASSSSSSSGSNSSANNKNETTAMLSMINRFVILIGKYYFCPALHRSSPGVSNLTKIWKPVVGPTTTTFTKTKHFCSFVVHGEGEGGGGKESFDDDDDDYSKDEAMKVDEFFRKTFANEDVVLYGEVPTPENEILPLYYANTTTTTTATITTAEKGNDLLVSKKEKRLFLKAVRLLQKSCEIVTTHLTAEIEEIRKLNAASNNNNNNNTNNNEKDGTFCSLVNAFETLVEIGERTQLRDLYYTSSSSSSSSSEKDDESPSSDSENYTGGEYVEADDENHSLKKLSSSSRKKQLAMKGKKVIDSLTKSMWGYMTVAGGEQFSSSNMMKNSSAPSLARVSEKNAELFEKSGDLDDDWDVVEVFHTLSRKVMVTSDLGNNETKKTSTIRRLPPTPSEDIDQYEAAMFTHKQ